jgi:fibronectin-binding autotransporter adhesin
VQIMMLKQTRVIQPLAASLVALMTALGAADAFGIAMTGPDTGTQSSFNTNVNWPNATDPSSGNNYETNGFQLRTPDNSDDHTFAGDQLTVNSTFNFRDTGNITVNSVDGSDGLVLSGGRIVPGFTGRRAVLSGLVTLNGSNIFQAADTSRGITVNSLVTGSGAVTLQSAVQDGGEVLFTNAGNDYTGTTTLSTVSANGVILRAGGENVFSPNSNVIVTAGSTVELDGNDNTIAGLSDIGGANAIVENASSTAAELTVQGSATNNSFGGTIQDGGTGALSFRKSGTATQVLTTANTYTGGTAIDGGTLRVDNAGALSGGDISIGVDSDGDGTAAGTLALGAVMSNTMGLEGRDNDTAHITATGGDTRSVTSDITLNETSGDNPAEFTFSADAGSTLALDGTITDNSAANNEVRFAGQGDTELNTALAMTTAGTDTVVKDGTGTLEVNAAITGVNRFDVNEGTANLNNAVLDTDSTAAEVSIDVASDAVLNQTVSAISRASQEGGVENDGTIDLNSQAASMNWLSGTDASATVQTTGAGSTLSIGNNDGQDGDYAGSLGNGGALSIVKDQASSQTVGGINTTGTVQVTDGALAAGTITNAGNVTADGGDLSVDGAATVADVTVASGSSADFNDASGATTTSASSIDNSGTLSGGGDAGDAGDVLSVTGTIGNSGDLTSAGSVDAGGDVDNSGTFDIGGTLDTDGTLTSSGSLTVDGDASANAANLTAGTATFDSDLTVDATLDNAATMIVAGNLSAVGAVTNTGSADIDGTFNSAALTNSGTLDVLQGATASSVALNGGSATFQSTLAVGGGTVTVSSGTNDVQGALTSGDVTVTSGSLALGGANTVGTVDVSGGSVTVQNSNALAGGAAETNVRGTGRVNIQGDGLDIDEIFNLAASGGGVQLNNVANENTITGSVNLVASTPAGQEQFRIESESGTLNLDGGVVSSLTGGNEILNLGGAGNGTVESLDMTTANASGIVKDGDGEWTLSNATMDNANEIVSQGGVLALADAANIDGAAIFDLAGGSLNVAGVTGGSSYDAGAFDGNGAFLIQSGQTLTGNGAVTGDMVVAGDLDIGSSFGEMVFGNLDLNGTVTIEVGGPAQNGLFNDLLRVTSLLDIVGASLVFDVVGALTRPAYVFATYGSLVPATGPFLKVTGKPDGWSVVYGYGGEDQIALVNDAPPLPAPGPLALIGLGALVWGGLRRRASRDATAS